MDEMTLEMAAKEYEEIEQLINAVDTNEPIVDPEDIDDLVL
jgi:hypothetical protein